jgi:Flp pilus assembly protein TadG
MNSVLGHHRGQVLALFGIGLVVLMGFMALAVDVGMLWSDRREMQTAADAAAQAGAAALRQGNNVTTAARDAAGLNSFTDGSVVDGHTISVTVNNPPSSGPYSGNANYVEAVVEQPQTTYFLRALGYNTVDVSTRAVSGYVNGPGCVISLNPSANNAITVSGSASINAPLCNVVDNSSASSTALNGSGSASITANAIGVVGGYTSATYTPTPKTGIAPLPDPLASLAAPTIGVVPAACNSLTKAEHGYTATGGETISPGVYCGGITVSGGKSLNLSAGLYILYGGGLTVSSSTISGSGVSFFNTGTASGNTGYKAINISGGSTASLSAPTTQLTGVTGGPWEGILFFQDRAVCSASSSFCDAAGSTSGNQNTISGGSGAGFSGAMYFPNTPVVYSGGSSSTGYQILIADAVTVSGPSNFGSDFSTLADGSPLKTSALYE